MWLDIKGIETKILTGKSKTRWKWKISEETDWTKYRIELEKEIARLKELNPEHRNRDIEYTWGAMAKSMKEVASRTVGKVHGKAARRGMAKNLRKAIMKRRVVLKHVRIVEETKMSTR